MIIVKVELHSAVTGKVTELGRLHITNDGTGTETRGNYDVERMARITAKRQVLAHGRVTNWPRKSASIWRLLRRALDAVLPPRNGYG